MNDKDIDELYRENESMRQQLASVEAERDAANTKARSYEDQLVYISNFLRKDARDVRGSGEHSIATLVSQEFAALEQQLAESRAECERIRKWHDESFKSYLERTAAEVATWPAWKQNALGTIGASAEQEKTKMTIPAPTSSDLKRDAEADYEPSNVDYSDFSTESRRRWIRRAIAAEKRADEAERQRDSVSEQNTELERACFSDSQTIAALKVERDELAKRLVTMREAIRESAKRLEEIVCTVEPDRGVVS